MKVAQKLDLLGDYATESRRAHRDRRRPARRPAHCRARA